MSQQSPQPIAAPDALVDPSGRVTFGVFDSPLPCINLEDARLTYRGLRLPRLAAILSPLPGLAGRGPG